MGTKQKEGESLQDYTKRFKVAKDVFESHIGGPLILYLDNADKAKYGSILVGLNTQQSSIIRTDGRQVLLLWQSRAQVSDMP